MTDTDTAQLEQLLNYRMTQARETLREAEILLAASAVRGTFNRAYYAMFYALTALLATKGLSTSKHSGTLALFDREFVKPGVFPPKYSRVVRMAFERRQRYDYGETVTPLSPDNAANAVTEATEFLEAVASYLRLRGYL